VLTKVGLDHVEFLGDTLEKITREKCGILRKGLGVVVDGSNDQVVLDIVKERVKELGTDDNMLHGSDKMYNAKLDDVAEQLGLARHQRQNIYTAWVATKAALQSSRLPTPKSRSSTSIQGIVDNLATLISQAQSSLPGRLQHLKLPISLLPSPTSAQPKILLDGAHNLDSAKALSEYFLTSYRKKSESMTFLIAMKDDKDIDAILQTLIRDGDHVITTGFGAVDGMPWVHSMAPRILAERVKKLTSGKVICCEDEDGFTEQPDERRDRVKSVLQMAVAVAIDAADGDTVNTRLCITGSLYLVGDVLRRIRNEESAN
jgi:dihydrofolate synthase